MSEVARSTTRIPQPLDATGLHHRPDWVMCGYPNGDGTVSVIASKSLDMAVLEYRADVESLWSDMSLFPIGHVVTSRTLKLEVYMLPDRLSGEAFVIITASTYGEALRHLMEHWSPDDGSTATQILPKEIER